MNVQSSIREFITQGEVDNVDENDDKDSFQHLDSCCSHSHCNPDDRHNNPASKTLQRFQNSLDDGPVMSKSKISKPPMKHWPQPSNDLFFLNRKICFCQWVWLQDNLKFTYFARCRSHLLNWLLPSVSHVPKCLNLADERYSKFQIFDWTKVNKIECLTSVNWPKNIPTLNSDLFSLYS